MHAIRLARRLALAAVAIPAMAAAAPPLAPPVVRPQADPAAAGPAAATPPPVPSPAPSCDSAGAAPCPAASVPAGSEQGYFNALSAAAGSGADPLLDKSLMTTMSRLLAVGRCGEAQALAGRSGRPALAAAAKRVCGGN